MAYRQMGDDYPITIGRERGYFEIRDTWLDLRGPIEIAATADFGFEVMLITQSHRTTLEGIGIEHNRLLKIDAYAWVANRAILFDCWIQTHAVVGAGAIVKHVIIPPWTLAQGNPAMLVAIWQNEKWARFARPQPPQRWRHA